MSINMDKMFAKVLQQKENEEQRKMKKTYVIDKYIKEDESDEKESDDDEKEK